MKISIVTPCHDRNDFLDDAITSVLSQAGDFEIQHIVQVSGSSPEVKQTLARWSRDVASGAFHPRCSGLDFQVHYEEDAGMYDGLNRGFARTDGEVLAWLNSDDLYHPGAFQSVSEIFASTEDVYWLTGVPNSFNARGSRTGFDRYPRAYSREFIRKGLYRIENVGLGFNWIAQDGCFWRRVLWQQAGAQLDASLRYTADFKLWQQFAEHADLVKVNSFLGGYRSHGNQFTGDPANYLNELPPPETPPTGWGPFHQWLTHHPEDQRFFFNPEKGEPWITGFGLEWEWLVGRTAVFNFETDRWETSLSPIL